MEEKQPSIHVIAASNPLYGAVNFIVLYMPPYWKALAGNVPPEIDEVKKFGKIQWVTSGSSTSVVYNNSSKAWLEVKIEARKKPILLKKNVELKAQVGGHDAKYSFGVEKVGLIKRREYDTLDVEFYCDVTSRYVRIKFRGPNARRVFSEILEYIGESICH